MFTSRSYGASRVTSRPPSSTRALGRRLEARDHPQARRLARARGPEHREELALADLEVDAVDRDDVPEALAHPDQPDGGEPPLPTRARARPRASGCANPPPCLSIAVRNRAILNGKPGAGNPSAASPGAFGRAVSADERRRGRPEAPRGASARPAVELADDPGTAEDERRVQLHRGGPGSQARRRRPQAGDDAAAGRDRHGPAGRAADLAHDPQRVLGAAPGRRARRRPSRDAGRATGRVFEHVSPSAPPVPRDPREREHDLALDVGPERRELHEQRRSPARARAPRSSVARCASLSRSRPHDTFGQLAFSSIASTCGSSSAWVSTASRSVLVGDAREPGAGPRDAGRASRAAASAPGVRQPHRVRPSSPGSGTGRSGACGLPAAGPARERPAHDVAEPETSEGVQRAARSCRTRPRARSGSRARRRRA